MKTSIIFINLLLCMLLVSIPLLLVIHPFFIIGICSFMIFITFCSSKWFLWFFKAKQNHQIVKLEDLLSQSKLKFEVDHINVYLTDRFNSNIFVLDDLITDPCILIGTQVFDLLSEQELRILLDKAVEEISCKTSFFKTSLCSTYFLFLNCHTRTSRPSLHFIRRISHFFIFPLALLQRVLCNIYRTKNSQGYGTVAVKVTSLLSQNTVEELQMVSPLALLEYNLNHNLFNYLTSKKERIS